MKIKTTVKLDEQAYKRLKHFSVETNKDMSEIINRALILYLKEETFDVADFWLDKNLGNLEEGGRKWKSKTSVILKSRKKKKKQATITKKSLAF